MFLKTWQRLCEQIENGHVAQAGVHQLKTWQLSSTLRTLNSDEDKSPAHRVSIVSEVISLNDTGAEITNIAHSQGVEVCCFLTKGDLEREDVREVAEEMGKTPVQVLLSWALQRGLVPVAPVDIGAKDARLPSSSAAASSKYQAWRDVTTSLLDQTLALLHPFTRRPEAYAPNEGRRVVLTTKQMDKLWEASGQGGAPLWKASKGKPVSCAPPLLPWMEEDGWTPDAERVALQAHLAETKDGQ